MLDKFVFFFMLEWNHGWRGIRGTQVEPYIQDIVDEVAPIKEAPLWDWGPIHSKVMSLD